MPVYQYACTECSEQLEVRQSFTDDALTVCPACEGRLRKVLNAVGVVFKGSGFYRTDSRNDSRNATAAANGTANGKDKSGSASGDTAASSGTTPSTPSTPSTKTADSGGSTPSSGSAGNGTGSKAAAAS